MREQELAGPRIDRIRQAHKPIANIPTSLQHGDNELVTGHFNRFDVHPGRLLSDPCLARNGLHPRILHRPANHSGFHG